jgi:putative ABC transport system ATP-binding protein
VIRLAGVRKRYRGAEVGVLCGVELEVADGEFVSVVGRSGSGKTTLLNLIGGLDTEFEGELEVDGKVLRGLADNELSAFRNRHVGYVFQAYHLLDHLSCGDNVAIAARFDRGGRGRGRAGWARRRADELLEAVGLAGAGRRSATTLSGGERQRVALARALFFEPHVLLCDEPTGNLDAETGHAVVELLKAAHSERGMTLIAATHDEAVAAAGGRTVELREGRLHGWAGETQ